MEPETETNQIATGAQPKSCQSNWQRFYERALDLLVSEPVRGRFTIKYNQKTRMCTLKITDGKRTVMKRTNSVNVQDCLMHRNYLKSKSSPSWLCKKAHVEEKQHHGKEKKKKDKKEKK